jgi:hypothetical protein
LASAGHGLRRWPTDIEHSGDRQQVEVDLVGTSCDELTSLASTNLDRGVPESLAGLVDRQSIDVTSPVKTPGSALPGR